MFDDQFRIVKEQMFIRVAQLGFVRLPPMMLSLIGLMFGVLTAVALIYQQYALGLICWFFNRVFDGLDGTVARRRTLQSDLGGYLDILIDFAVYAILPIALVLGRPSSIAWLTLAFLLATFYVNSASWMYLSAILEKRNISNTSRKTSVTMPQGLIGGVATIIFYSLFMLFPQYLSALFVVMGAMVIITILQRVFWALEHLGDDL